MSAPADLGAPALAADEFQLELGRRLKSERQRRGLTLKEIEQRVGISATHLSEIERGKSSPTVGVLERIAQALGTRAALLVETSPSPGLSHVRPADRRVVASVDGTIRYEVLSDRFPGAEVSLLLVTLAPGSRGRVRAHEGEEILHVIEGGMRVQIEHEEYRLEAGDTLHFRATRPHAYVCAADRRCVAMIGTRPCYAL
jgi:transcriptional regulator with XRE-family HTH domain